MRAGNSVKHALALEVQILQRSMKLHNKQLLDEVFVICGIINVEVRVISRAEGEADNSYRDVDNFAHHKNRIR